MKEYFEDLEDTRQQEKIKYNLVEVVVMTVIAVTGGSRDDNYNHIHMISAWANKTGIMLGQMREDEKSNEIPAVPELLDLIDVEECIFTRGLRLLHPLGLCSAP